MGELIDDLLRLSQISRWEMKRERLDLTALVETVAAELRLSAPQRPVRLDVEPGLAAWGDPRLLRIALENLLGNAWKFTSKKPSAVVAVGRVEQAGGPAYFVRDDGAGFDMAHAGKLFAPFSGCIPSRSSGNRDRAGDGAAGHPPPRRAGVGQGRPDRGATFHFTLRRRDRG